MEIINLKSAVSPTENDPKILQITDIKQAVKNENRVNIFVNKKYEFSLDISQLVDFKLKIGTILTEEDLAKYKKASLLGKTYQRLLEWTLTRPHSVKEAKDYLNRTQRQKAFVTQVKARNDSFWGHPQERLCKSEKRGAKVSFGGIRSCYEDEATSPVKTGARSVPERNYCGPTLSTEDQQELLDRLISKGYLDDEKFAEYYVENRFVKKGISEKRLKMELRKKGISQEIIEKVLSKNLRNDEEEIKKIIQKKRQKYDDQKLIMYLARQGFDFELARNLVRDSSEKDSQNLE